MQARDIAAHHDLSLTEGTGERDQERSFRCEGSEKMLR